MEREHESAGAKPPTTEIRWPQAGVAQVALTGEHDLCSAGLLSRALTQTLEECVHLIVDLRSTELIDSSTIRVLIATKDRASAKERRFSLLLGATPIIERALELTGALTALNRVTTSEEALRIQMAGHSRAVG